MPWTVPAVFFANFSYIFLKVLVVRYNVKDKPKITAVIGMAISALYLAGIVLVIEAKDVPHTLAYVVSNGLAQYSSIRLDMKYGLEEDTNPQD